MPTRSGLLTTTPEGDALVMIPKNRVPTHPGEILLEEFLAPLGITQVALAHHIGVPVQRVNELVRGKRGITPETPRPPRQRRPRGHARRHAAAAAPGGPVPRVGVGRRRVGPPRPERSPEAGK